MRNQSIVCFANDWDSDPTSKHHVMRILSKSNKILWINSISMRRPTISSSDVHRMWKKVKSCLRGVTRVNDNLFHFTPLVLPFPSSRKARGINRYLLQASISYYKKKLGMKDVQLWTFLPNIVELLGKLGEKKVIYYCVDEWSKFSFMDGRSMQEMEIELLKRADLVITTAEHLYREKIKYNQNTHLVSHGVDYVYFSRALSGDVRLAEEIRDIKKPIIGFFGLIHEWIDLGLIEEIARSRPEWSIVLIGKASVDVDRLKQYKNIHLLGQKKYNELINYCVGFDVGLIPFRINELTVNVNPIKLREYLAAGIPVVSTPLPEVCRYKDLVEIGATYKEAIEKTEELLKGDSDQKKKVRSEKMIRETWEAKVEEITGLVDKLK